MTKRISRQLNSFRYRGEPIRITLGTLILVGLCVLFLIMATFTQLTLTHLYIPFDAIDFLQHGYSDNEIMQHFTKTYRYIPQIPMVFFIMALLGRKFGIFTVCCYVVLGMFSPVFALGGGASYIFEYGFGYILAFIPAMFFSGTLLKVKTDFLRIVLLSLLGVCIIHLLGILYMLFVATLRHAPMDLISSWIASQSGVQILYDIFFSILAVYMGRIARRFLWLVMC